MSDNQLRERLREILFAASGGITDMADEEIDQILAPMIVPLLVLLPMSYYDR